MAATWFLWTAIVAAMAAGGGVGKCQTDAPLPPGVKAVWDMSKALHETTPTRERICINGLWRWQPGGPPSTGGAQTAAGAETVPAGNWGFFKVPGCWPGITDYMEKDCQTLYTHPSWADVKPGEVTTAWYQREIAIPAGWAGRRVLVSAEYVNSYATFFVDGRKAGQIRFPAGELDLTALCPPGSKHLLSVLVVAMPLKAVMMSFGDSAAPKAGVAGSVNRRGLCGDVFLVGEPAGARVADPRVQTSVTKGAITFDAALEGLATDRSYALRAVVTDAGRPVREFTSKSFRSADLKDGRFAFTEAWKPEKLWDIHTPGNQYDVAFSLLGESGDGRPATGGTAAARPAPVPGLPSPVLLDTALPLRFGFRELETRGRDFYLNGSRIYLSALPFDNAQVGAAWASYEGAKESMLRLKSIGINFVYTHNYGCEPGTHLGFSEILRAADDVGMLVSLSQPHFGQYDWKAADADQSNGYARHAAFYVQVAGSHPSVVFYSMSHNATGYADDMNPDLIDGISDPRQSWALNNARLALRAEGLVHGMDPSRIVYHHSSGNLSSMHDMNFYTNFAPLQELDDWFEHWATVGVKPVFTCEYMVPCTWDFTMYRGWYKGARTFGSAVVPWDFSIAEWSSQFLGDTAYRISDAEKENIRWEADQYRAGKLWHRWDYPHQVGDKIFDIQHEIIGTYLASNWRAFRTWGVSAVSPWEHHFFWKVRDGVDKSRKALKVDWENLQRPGFSPDYLDERYERMDLAFERNDWVPTADGQAILRNNMPLLAYIGGKPERFTSKDHLFTPGETFEKQLIIINNSRMPVTADCKWSALPTSGPWGGPAIGAGTRKVTIKTGEQERVPMLFPLPATLAPGAAKIDATVTFSTGETQSDSFVLNVVPKPQPPQVAAKVAIFDPKGETGKLLAGMGITAQAVQANADLAGYDVLVVGKGALTLNDPAPNISRVRDGLRVVLFEQTPEVLEKRFGFRVAEYGLRQVFPRIPSHPLLAGLSTELLRDWRGASTLLPPRLKYEMSAALNYVPAVKWCGMDVSRVWRCGNQGNVASSLIEKPACGDFLPILDGGYSLQYSPLMEYREGKGMILFCQLDVTGRTEADPVAQKLAGSILGYAATWKSPARPATNCVLYAGSALGRRHLEHAGLTVADYAGGALTPGQVLVVGAGGGAKLAGSKAAVAAFLKAGGHILALGLDAAEANAFLPAPVKMAKAEHINATFAPPSAGSPFQGIGPADVHNRDPREIPLVAGGAAALGGGVLAAATDGSVVFFQLPPTDVSKAEGAVPSFEVDGGDASEGKQSALLTMGSVNGIGVQFGQKIAGGEAGKTYTFAVSARALDEPVVAHLEIERPSRPWDRAVKAADVTIPAGAWSEVHTTFTTDKPFAEGWYAYVACGQEGGRLRLDNFRLYEGAYQPGKVPAGAKNLFTNEGFEGGTDPWKFPYNEAYNIRKTYRRASATLTRLLANLGAAGTPPILDRFTTPVSGAPKPSVVRNGDFAPEAGKEGLPGPWQFSPTAKDATCAVEAMPGGRCVRITCPAAGPNEKTGAMLCQHDVPIEKGQWYRMSLKAKWEGERPVDLSVAIPNMDGWISLIDYQHPMPTAEWREFEFLVQAKGSAATKTRFQIWHTTPGTLWLADVRMAPCDAPTTGRWAAGLYLDDPEEWDDPYRFFRW